MRNKRLTTVGARFAAGAAVVGGLGLLGAGVAHAETPASPGGINIQLPAGAGQALKAANIPQNLVAQAPPQVQQAYTQATTTNSVTIPVPSEAAPLIPQATQTPAYTPYVAQSAPAAGSSTSSQAATQSCASCGGATAGRTYTDPIPKYTPAQNEAELSPVVAQAYDFAKTVMATPQVDSFIGDLTGRGVAPGQPNPRNPIYQLSTALEQLGVGGRREGRKTQYESATARYEHYVPYVSPSDPRLAPLSGILCPGCSATFINAGIDGVNNALNAGRNFQMDPETFTNNRIFDGFYNLGYGLGKFSRDPNGSVFDWFAGVDYALKQPGPAALQWTQANLGKALADCLAVALNNNGSHIAMVDGMVPNWDKIRRVAEALAPAAIGLGLGAAILGVSILLSPLALIPGALLGVIVAGALIAAGVPAAAIPAIAIVASVVAIALVVLPAAAIAATGVAISAVITAELLRREGNKDWLIPGKVPALVRNAPLPCPPYTARA